MAPPKQSILQPRPPWEELTLPLNPLPEFSPFSMDPTVPKVDIADQYFNRPARERAAAEMARANELDQPLDIMPMGSAQPQPTQYSGVAVPTESMTSGGSHSETTQLGIKIPGWEGKLGAAIKQQKDAARLEAKHEGIISQKEDNAYEELQTQIDDKDREIEGRRAELQNRRTVIEDKLARAREEAIIEKVDPENWWSTRGTGQKIAATIAMALGGFTEGWTQGRVKNVAAQMISTAIERDIAAQETNMRKKVGERGEMTGLLASLESRIGNLDISKAQFRVMAAGDIKVRLARGQAQARDPLIKAKLQRSLAGADMVKLNAEKDFQTVSQPKTTTHDTKTWQKVPVPAQDPRALQSAAVQAFKALPKELKKDIRETVFNQEKHFGELFHYMEKLVKQSYIGSFGEWTPLIQGKAKVLKATRKAMAVALAKAAHGGPAPPEEVHNFEQLIPGPNATKGAMWSTVKRALGEGIGALRRRAQYYRDTGATGADLPIMAAHKRMMLQGEVIRKSIKAGKWIGHGKRSGAKKH